MSSTDSELHKFIATLKIHNKDLDTCLNDAVAVFHLEQLIAAQKQRWVKDELEALKPLVRDYDGNDMILDILNDRIAAFDGEIEK